MSKRIVDSGRWSKAGIAVGSVVLGLAVGQHATRAAQTSAPPAHTPHWSYDGEEDPSHWASLSPEFALCGSGHQQSPIDIVTKVATPLQAGAAGFESAHFDTTDRRTVTVDVVNNGHTIQVDAVGSDVLVIGSDRYLLQQFHFHTPSEHTVDGRAFPLEVHFVYRTAGGKLTVIAMMLEEGAENVALTPYWSRMPKSAGPPVDLGKGGVDVHKILPTHLAVYRYAGSLTTPPCSEGVSWMLLKEHGAASRTQIEAFRTLMRHDNRPTQSLNGRAVHDDVIH